MSNMFNLKYEIKKSEDGRPYVELSKDNVDHPEHKFMALEITRYLLLTLLKDNEETQDLRTETEIEIVKTINVLDDISNEIGSILVGQNNALDDLGLTFTDDD